MDTPSAPPAAAVPQSWYRRLYTRVQALSGTKHAVPAFLGVAFLDSSVFPVPPFALMVPMVLSRPRTWLRLSVLGVVSSVLGGLVGYGLGALFGVEVVSRIADPQLLERPFAEMWHGHGRHILTALGKLGIEGQTPKDLIQQSLWVLVVLSSILPTPFKLVAIGSGLLKVPLHTFVAAAVMGRSIRFFAVGLACRFGGERARRWFKL